MAGRQGSSAHDAITLPEPPPDLADVTQIRSVLLLMFGRIGAAAAVSFASPRICLPTVGSFRKMAQDPRRRQAIRPYSMPIVAHLDKSGRAPVDPQWQVTLLGGPSKFLVSLAVAALSVTRAGAVFEEDSDRGVRPHNFLATAVNHAVNRAQSTTTNQLGPPTSTY